MDGHQRRIGDAASESSDLVLWKMAVGSASNDEDACGDQVQVFPPGRVRMIALVGNGLSTRQSNGRGSEGLVGTTLGGVAGRGGGGSSSASCLTILVRLLRPDRPPLHRGSVRSRSPLRDGGCEGTPERLRASTPANSPPDVNCLRAHASRLRHPAPGGQCLDHRGPGIAVLAKSVKKNNRRESGVPCDAHANPIPFTSTIDNSLTMGRLRRSDR